MKRKTKPSREFENTEIPGNLRSRYAGKETRLDIMFTGFTASRL